MIPTDPWDLAEGNKPITASNRYKSCPNCKSKNFEETISREYCPDCTYEVNYWSGYCSPVEEAYSKRRWAEEEAEREERERKYEEEENWYI